MKGFIKKIEKINFGLMSPEDIRAMSVVTIETPDTYEDDGFPIEKGLMDQRLGVIDPSLVCRTCGFRGGDCQGHFGSIELARPVIHIGFGDVIHKILRSVCNDCGRVVLTDDVIEDYREKIMESMSQKENISEILKEFFNKSKAIEMKDDKQDEIVGKLLDDFFPEDIEGLAQSKIESNLLKLSKQLFTEAYLKDGENEDNEYIDPKYLCPHCKKNSSFKDIQKTFDSVESKIAQEGIDYIFNFNKILTTRKADLTGELDKLVRRIKKLFLSKFDDEYSDDELIPFNEFKSSIAEYKRDINDKSELNDAVIVYEKALSEFNEGVFKNLNISKSKENAEEYDKFINAVEDAGTLVTSVLDDFENDKENHVVTETRNFVKTYFQKFIQEPIKLDKPVTIRQGDYKLTPSEVRERLERITDEDSYVLGVNPEVARPEWLVLTVLPVPPVTVRPSITLDTGERSEDDLTHKLVDILRINQRLIENMDAGAPQLIVEDLWELLQYHVTTYFDNEASGVPPARHRSGRPLKTLTQRLKGKEGRFRSNLSGKRVNFSARTVISPDPNISINEVG